MSITDVDIILKRLSNRFHKIFYDREFVGCIQEDFKVILENRNRCSVVVFPLLCPNYFKAVQYQAEIFDLEVLLLGSAIAVCDKKFLIKKPKKCEEQIMPSNEQECGVGSTLKKKRPERQLYIPPAQRRVPVNELPQQNIPPNDQGSSAKTKKQYSCRKRELPKKIKTCDKTFKLEPENVQKLNEDSIGEASENKIYKIMQNYTFLWWKYALFEPSREDTFASFKSTVNFAELKCSINFDGFKIFDLQRNILTLYILGNDYVLWQPKIDVIVNRGNNFKVKVIPLSNIDMLNTEIDICKRVTLTEVFLPIKTYFEVMDNYSVFCDFDIYWLTEFEKPITFLDICCKWYYYLTKEDVYNESKLIEELLLIEDCHDNVQLDPENVDKKEKIQETTNIPVNGNSLQLDLHLQKNNLNFIKNTLKVFENAKKEKTDLEEEKEIMRKTKENINRKTRPIIKYVEEANDTLKIDKDDVNNWEDLFNEEGQLQEDLLKEIVHKVGNDVTIIKAKEDYSDYFSKHVNIEELEHMVELYDFPATLETHDLIHAFSEIKSDAMYVKWVDDTHAILVLGSSSQAQKAINVQNPLIKVRPMTAASKGSLSTAYRYDLKPVMKRPPTNLQTARRLITTHLGTKSGITQERSAKERNDLKAAREMKKLVKKNEQDAWEGNFRSSTS